MRINEEYKKSGYFWLPSSPTTKIPGTIIISDGGDILLEILGNFEDNISAIANTDFRINRIVGFIEDDGYITLENCYYKNKNISFGKISKSSIIAMKMISGAAYEEDDKITARTYQFSVEGLDDWISISGIKVENKFEEKSATIKYSVPQSQDIYFSANVLEHNYAI